MVIGKGNVLQKRNKENQGAGRNIGKNRVIFIIEEEDAASQRFWEIFEIDNMEQTGEIMTWEKNEPENNIRNPGNVDIY